MIRRSTLVWSVLAVVAGAGLFVVKHEVRDLEQRLGQLNRAILEDQQAIHVLKAEWSYLNQPARFDRLGRNLLGLEPLRGERVVAFAALGTVAPPSGRTVPRSEPLPRLMPAARPPPHGPAEGWLRVLFAGLEARR